MLSRLLSRLVNSDPSRLSSLKRTTRAGLSSSSSSVSALCPGSSCKLSNLCEHLVIIIIMIIKLFLSYSYQITYRKSERNLVKEVVLGLFSSVLLGFGTLFFMLSAGVYL
jgi:hypothetical protein